MGNGHKVGSVCVQEDKFEILTKLAYAVFGEENENSVVKLLTKMNGRTDRLEAWRNRMVGAISVITACLIPLAYLLIKNWDKIIK